MPSPIHEGRPGGVAPEIARQLSTIASRQGPSADFALDTKYRCSETIEFDDADYGRHDPDTSFRHSKAQYPGVVIEA
jgi:hypothetical protein